MQCIRPGLHSLRVICLSAEPGCGLSEARASQLEDTHMPQYLLALECIFHPQGYPQVIFGQFEECGAIHLVLIEGLTLALPKEEIDPIRDILRRPDHPVKAAVFLPHGLITEVLRGRALVLQLARSGALNDLGPQ